MTITGTNSENQNMAFKVDSLIVGGPNTSTAWTVTSSSTGTVTPLDFALTATGAGASVDGAKFTAATEAALGTYANALNAKLDFGTAGAVTGLGGAFCSELDLGAGTTAGTYAVFEGELNVPSGGKTGTSTSFFALNVWGADVATFDTNGYLFNIQGVTGAEDKFFDSAAEITNVNEITGGLRIKIGSSDYYILLATAADTADA